MNVFDLMAKLTLDASEYTKGLNDAEGQAEGFGDKWKTSTDKMKSGFKDIGVGVGIFAGMGAAAFKAADNMSQNLDTIDKMSQKLGLSTDAYQEWDYILKLSGADINSMGAGIKTLTNKLDAAKGGTESAVEAFQKLGFSMEDLEGMSREDLFSNVIYAFQGMEDNAERAALANELLGKSGAELGPLFNGTAEDTQALIAQFEEMGGVIGEDAVKDGAAFQDSLTTMQMSIKAASASLFEKLIPAITDLMDKINEFIQSGGLDTIIGLLEKLAPVILAVVSAFAAMKIITGVVELIQGFTVAMGILNAVLLANPILLVVAAIASLIAILVVAYNKCEAFREKVDAAFNKVRDGVIAAIDKIKEAVQWLKDLPENAKQWGKDMLDNFKKGMEERHPLLTKAVSGIAGGIKKVLGFSEPEEGPLSNFHTFAPDMMDLFIKGIEQRKPKLEMTVSDVADTVRNSMSAQPIAPSIQNSGAAATVSAFNALIGSLGQQEHTTIIQLDGKTIAKAVDKPLRDIERQRGLSLAGGEAW